MAELVGVWGVPCRMLGACEISGATEWIGDVLGIGSDDGVHREGIAVGTVRHGWVVAAVRTYEIHDDDAERTGTAMADEPGIGNGLGMDAMESAEQYRDI